MILKCIEGFGSWVGSFLFYQINLINQLYEQIKKLVQKCDGTGKELGKKWDKTGTFVGQKWDRFLAHSSIPIQLDRFL